MRPPPGSAEGLMFRSGEWPRTRVVFSDHSEIMSHHSAIQVRCLGLPPGALQFILNEVCGGAA